MQCFTICISLYDLKNLNTLSNSKNKKYVYRQTQKCMKPEEVAFTCDLFAAIEQIFNLEKNTVKVGIMDEEEELRLILNPVLKKLKKE